MNHVSKSQLNARIFKSLHKQRLIKKPVVNAIIGLRSKQGLSYNDKKQRYSDNLFTIKKIIVVLGNNKIGY